MDIDDVAHLRMLNDRSHLQSFLPPFDLPPPVLLIAKAWHQLLVWWGVIFGCEKGEKAKREDKTEHKWEEGYFHVAISKGAPPMVCYTQSYTHPFFTAIPFDIFTIFIIFGISSANPITKKGKTHIGNKCNCKRYDGTVSTREWL